jgi:hypothetical protein
VLFGDAGFAGRQAHARWWDLGLGLQQFRHLLIATPTAARALPQLVMRAGDLFAAALAPRADGGVGLLRSAPRGLR